ncbi:MAG TPA: hypothetical protein VFA26_25070 [Gemmataceae bacterium]|nr:hypothetical protein [Gemmataceae bacterium]
MRASLTAALAVAACLAPAAAARAGVYTTTEKSYWPLPTGELRHFLLEYRELRGIPAPTVGPPENQQPNPLHEAYKKKVAELEAKEHTLGLSVEDRVNLGAYYLRLAGPGNGDHVRRAVATLEAVPRDRRDFMVLGNLSMAYQLEGQLDRAVNYLEEARKAWPQSWPGYTTNQLAWLYRAETFQLNLLRHRQQEAAMAAREGRKPALALDPLFPRARLGKAPYHAGWLPPERAAELPQDAVNVVAQLLLWQPFDDALYWQMGELLNARGDVTAAYRVLDEMSFSRETAPELVSHRKVLRDASEALAQMNGARAFQAITLLAPPSPLGVPAGGQVAQLLSREAAAQEIDRRARGGGEKKDAAAPQEAAAPAARALDWKQILIAFAFGAAVATLAGMQYREMRRRRQEAAAAPRA